MSFAHPLADPAAEQLSNQIFQHAKESALVSYYIFIFEPHIKICERVV
jgi:hypothetical protein